jgi:hypothetical protein
MATSFGFRMVRRLVRMRRGRLVERRNNFIFALAGFEFG